MGKSRPVIALLTDFGTRDAYAACLKGVLLSGNPKAVVVDITHEIPPGNVLSASYALALAWDCFPAGTVFAAVVDPLVGTDRRTLIAEWGGKFLIAPDNGLVSLLVRLHGTVPVYELRDDFLKTKPAPTFHGRDVFAPAAVRLACGGFRRLRGAELKPALLREAFSEKTGECEVRGRVIHLDRFGNGITSLRGEEIGSRDAVDIEFTARGRFVKEPYRVRVSGIKRTYADVPEGKPLAYVGSLGFLEIGVRNGSAADKLGLRQNAPVKANWGA